MHELATASLQTAFRRLRHTELWKQTPPDRRRMLIRQWAVQALTEAIEDLNNEASFQGFMQIFEQGGVEQDPQDLPWVIGREPPEG